ncbi:ABC transporter substrate-binding protein [Bacteroidia bacterium]|nr:ABC transporter substrate-binding protein [Bacteroidia bacterium]
MFSWHSHWAHNEGVQVWQAEGSVLYASKDGIVFVPTGEELCKLSGLSHVGISAVHYEPVAQTLWVGYENGNIEQVRIAGGNHPNIVTEDIASDARFVQKTIHRFARKSPDLMLAASDVGIVEIDPRRGEITNNFTIHPQGQTLAVQDLVRFGEWWVAATAMGIFYCTASHPQWYYFGNWSQTLDGIAVATLAVHNNTLFVLTAADELLQTVDLQNFTTVQTGVKMLCVESNQLWWATSTQLHNATTSQDIDVQGLTPISVCTADNTLWLADKRKGLLALQQGKWEPQLTGKLPNNESIQLATHQGIVRAAGNGFVAQWQAPHWQSDTCAMLQQATALKINPSNPSHSVAATATQLLEFEGLTLTSVRTAAVGERIAGIEFTAQGELWLVCSQSASPLRLRTTEGTWQTIDAPALNHRNINAVARCGNVLWGVVDKSNVFAYSYNQVPAALLCYPIAIRDDYFTNTTTANYLFAERSNELWMGTNKGVVAYAAGNFLRDSLQARKIAVESDLPGYAAYLLQYDTLSTAAVDGGNRKWLATAGAGIFLQSANGSQTLQAFNSSNSPLPSNRIVSMAANDKTGEVYFATNKGVLSFTADATVGEDDFSSIKIYPNPVRPESQWVSIAGLAEDATVKITDAAGRLVYRGNANGGTLTWDLQHWRGGKVSTGVYFVFLLNADGNQKQVGKLLIVH